MPPLDGNVEIHKSSLANSSTSIDAPLSGDTSLGSSSTMATPTRIKTSPSTKAPLVYLVASGLSALVGIPLWKAKILEQAGYQPIATATNVYDRENSRKGFWSRYSEAIQPPYRGIVPAWTGMTVARAFIFYGSDRGKVILKQYNEKKENQVKFSQFSLSIIPSITCSIIAQVMVNPLYRAGVLLQNPETPFKTAAETMFHIYKHEGFGGLWRGSSIGIIKTAPRYGSSLYIRDLVNNYFEKESFCLENEKKIDNTLKKEKGVNMYQSGVSSLAAGLAGAVLTNPLDVVRASIFKREGKERVSILKSVSELYEKEGIKFLSRGLERNLISVAVPVTFTLFLSDLLATHFQ